MNTTKTETQSGTPVRRRRRQYVVDPRFQRKCALAIGLSVFFLSTVISSALYLVLFDQARARMINPEHGAGNASIVVLVCGVIFAALTSGALGFWSCMFTNRICGPLLVIRRYLDEIAQGHLPSVRPFRKKDELSEFCQSFRESVESLKTVRTDELDVLTHVIETAKYVSQNDPVSSRETLEEVVRQLSPLQKAAAKSLGRPLDEITDIVDLPVGAAT